MSYNILIVDDEVAFAQVTQEMIEILGEKSKVAYNLDSAKELAQKEKFDFLFLDMNIRHESGYRFLEFLKDNNISIKQIYLMSGSEQPIKEEWNAVVEDILIKPFDLTTIIENLIAFKTAS